MKKNWFINCKFQILTIIILVFIMGCSPQKVIQTPPVTNNTPTFQPTNTEPTSTNIPTPEGFTCVEGTIPYGKVLKESYSPDGNWKAEVKLEKTGETARSVFFISLGNSIKWEVENVQYTCPDLPGVFPFPTPFYWTKDGHYLYFSHDLGGDGCFGGSSHTITDLKRLDLYTGKTELVTDNGGLWSSFSPDEKKIAFVSFGSEPGAEVFNLETNKRQKIDLLIDKTSFSNFDWNQTNIVWSTDSSEFVYLFTTGYCRYTDYHSWLIRVQPNMNSSEVIFSSQEEIFEPVSWDETGKVLILQGESLLLLDPETKKTLKTK
ncbi:MAG: hypothetical protein C0410_04470 [Anaerolinea sp.]|nr:hypothetical protein [Anaerolinea sp.]